MKAVNEELQATIEKLERDLKKEKDYNLQLFVDEQVTQMCQRAYFSFKILTREN